MDIIVYTTPSCPYCLQLKDFLEKNKIEYKEIDLGNNQKLAEKIVKKSGQMAVPITEIDGEIIVGFDKEKLGKKLNLKKDR